MVFIVCLTVVVAGFIVSSYFILDSVGAGAWEQLKLTISGIYEHYRPPRLSPEQENWLRECGTRSMVAYEAYTRGKMADAPEQQIACYSEALSQDPLYAWAYRARALVYQRQGEYDRAIADYTKAIEIDPRFSLAYNGLALTLWEKHDFTGIRNLTRFAGLNGVQDAIPDRLIDLVQRVPVSWIDGGQVAHA
ncbi:MAG: tetratricopeptide repeat protein [Planctomycetes bacterium]|nr:tetratricopeptide repeat protein [Planctomycetota bacterium]